jgi:hypothetical protein
MTRHLFVGITLGCVLTGCAQPTLISRSIATPSRR